LQSRFDGVPEKDFLQARNRANPYEAVGRSIFINRAAVKMANMDYLFKLLDRRVRQLIYVLFLTTKRVVSGWSRRGNHTAGSKALFY